MEEQEEKEPTWKDKLLHGGYHQQIEEVTDVNKSKPRFYNAVPKLVQHTNTEKLNNTRAERGIREVVES